MKRKKLVITALLAVMMFAGATMAAAQNFRGQGNGNCPRDGVGYHKGKGFHRGDRGMHFLGCLNLTDEQKTKVRGILNTHLDEIKAKKQAVIEARQNMAEVIHSANPAEENVRAAHKTFAAAQEEATVLRVKIMNEVKQVLTDAQKAELEKRRAERIERMKTRFDRKWDRMEEWLDGSDA
ncbi:MAG: Spy/CpxP family protein refolding chaperone [Desulfobacterales bacterium]